MVIEERFLLFHLGDSPLFDEGVYIDGIFWRILFGSSLSCFITFSALLCFLVSNFFVPSSLNALVNVFPCLFDGLFVKATFKCGLGFTFECNNHLGHSAGFN